MSFIPPSQKERKIYQHVYIFEWLLSFLEATPNNVHNAEEEGKEDLKKIDVQGWNYKVIYSNTQVCGMKITGKGIDSLSFDKGYLLLVGIMHWFIIFKIHSVQFTSNLFFLGFNLLQTKKKTYLENAEKRYNPGLW